MNYSKNLSAFNIDYQRGKKSGKGAVARSAGLGAGRQGQRGQPPRAGHRPAARSSEVLRLAAVQALAPAPCLLGLAAAGP